MSSPADSRPPAHRVGARGTRRGASAQSSAHSVSRRNRKWLKSIGFWRPVARHAAGNLREHDENCHRFDVYGGLLRCAARLRGR
jgi:hypothetical protein